MRTKEIIMLGAMAALVVAVTAGAGTYYVMNENKQAGEVEENRTPAKARGGDMIVMTTNPAENRKN